MLIYRTCRGVVTHLSSVNVRTFTPEYESFQVCLPWHADGWGEMPSWIWVLQYQKPRSCSSMQQTVTAVGSDTQWTPGVLEIQTFICHKPWHGMMRTLPVSGWKQCGVGKPIIARLGSAVAQAAPRSCLLAAPTCSFLVWERSPSCLLHWHYNGHPKSESCSPQAQVHPCAARH